MNILEKTERFIQRKLQSELPSKNLYHNINHASRVVDKVEYLAGKEELNEEETETLLIAAWFHDIGFVEGKEGHEQLSADMADRFLTENEYPKEKIEKVKELILATKVGFKPKNLSCKIIKDADCSHVAESNYMDYSDLLLQEENLIHKEDEKQSKLDWLRGNVEFFKKHKFHTVTALQEWLPKKEENLYELHKEIEKREKKKAKNDAKTKKLGRGVETMFRVTLKNHIQLSAIADSKANILLSVNAIIISIALSTLLPKLDNISNNYLILPTLCLLFFSVVSIVMSILSTRPKISKITVTKEMVMGNKTNILFFGNFYKMSLEDFEWGIDYLIENEETLYNSLTKDLYFLGLVLERKYRLLRITYNIFMVGIVVSAISFVVSFFLTANIS